MLRLFTVFALALLASAFCAGAEDQPPKNGFYGTIEGKYYVSPTGVFKVVIPVLPELGGEITDTPNVVTFQDGFNVHISIAAVRQDATQRWENSTRGIKDYLIYFFRDYVLKNFRQSYEGVQIESAKFLPGMVDGSLLTYILIPAGTMFPQRASIGPDGRAPVAKRGNLLFVKNEHVFVISIELAERSIEGKLYSKTTSEEDEILRQRLNDVVAKIEFAKLPTTAPSAAPKTAPSAASTTAPSAATTPTKK